MSMHKIPLTPTEDAGLRAHGLDIGTPSQLSDAFRQGVAWGIEHGAKPFGWTNQQGDFTTEPARRDMWEQFGWEISTVFVRSNADVTGLAPGKDDK